MKPAGHHPASIPTTPSTRRRIWEIDAALCCSVLGSCLALPMLRKAVLTIESDAASLDDFALHERAIRLAAHRDTGRGINKLLDQVHDVAIRRFARAHDEHTLAALWSEAKREGNIPGAYWALASHRACTPDLLKSAFGDVHMLSHLVGAANRADIRRLSELDAQNAGLAETITRQQAHIHALRASLDVAQRESDRLLAERPRAPMDATRPFRPEETVDPAAEAMQRTEQLAARIGREIAHREAIQRRLEATTRILAELRETLQQQTSRNALLELEISHLEETLAGPQDRADSHGPETIPDLRSGTLLYVGGRGTPIEKLRRFVEARHATFVHHDGGQEDRTPLIAALAGRADWIVFPVSQVSHEAMQATKRAARQQGKRYVPMRSTSLASLIAALQILVREAPARGKAHTE